MTFDLFDSPELLDIQRIGFYRFLNQGIPQLLTKEFPIKVKNGSYSIHVFINEKNVKLIAPEDDPRDCILKMKTYSCKLYAQVQIVCKKSSGFSNEKTNCRPYSACSKIVYQSSPEWIFLGQLPMMTKRGHFIINGSPRVIVHQVVRAPGIYFQKLIKKDDQNRARFYGDIIPLKGVWVRLQMTKKGRIEAKFKKGKKVEVEFLQKCLEIIENQINLSLNFSDRSFETKNFLRPPLHCTERVLGAKNAFFAQGKVRKDKSGNWSKWLGRQAFFYSTPKLKRCKNLCFQFAKNSSLSFYGDFTSLGIKKKNNEISFPIDDNYSNVLEKRKTRAESKAEHDAFIHTYDKLYRTSQDKELEEWQKKKKNLNFFKGSSLHKNVSSKKSSFCKKSGALTSCKVKNFACPYLRAPTKQLQGITKKGGRFGHQEQNHDLTFCKTNAFRSLSSTENAFKRKKCSENLFATFKIKSRYDLGVVGREKINNKFGLTRCTPLLAEPTLAVSCRASLPEGAGSFATKTSPLTASCLAMPRRGREAHAPSCPFLQNSALYVQQAKSKQGKQQVIGSRVKPRSKWFGNQEILLTDQCNTQLTALDLCSASLWLHKLRKGEQNSDDIDHSQNRRVRTSGDLLQTQFENGVDRLKNVVSAKLQERRGGNLGYSIFSSIFKTSYKNRYNRKFFFKERFKTTFSHVEMTPFVQNFPKNLKWKIGKKLGFLCKNSITFESFLPFSNPAKNLLSTKFYNFTALQGGARYDSLKKVSTRDILFVKKKIIVKKISKRKIAIAQLVVSRKFLVSKRCTYSGLPYSNLCCPALRVCFGFKGEKKFLIGSEKDCFVQGRRNCQYQKSEFRLQNQEIVSVYKKNSYKLSPKELFSTKPITGALREFFGSNPLSQYMDQTNPLAEITHKRRISSLGIGGVSRESAGMAIRGIHPTHYGRICPIETPEGKNAGLVNSLAFYTKVDINGFLKTPYYRVFKGQIQSSLGFSFCSAKEESLTSLQIAPSDLQKSWNNILRTKLSTLESVPVRVTDNLLDVFKKENPYKVKLIAISPIQMISVATSLIPFLEHNDANRALMGSNMQRQAVPLMISERPIVGTGLESNVIVESGHITESKVSGFASHVTANKIVIDTLQENLEKKLFSSKGRMFRFPNFFKDRGRVTIAIFAVPQRDVTRTLPIVDWHVKGHGKEAHANLRPSRAPYLQCRAPFCPFGAVQVGVSRGTASCARGARQSTPFTEGVGAGSFATKIGKVRVLGVGRKLTRKGGRQNKKIFTRFAPISFGRKNKICADFKKKQFFLKSNRHSLTTFSRSNQNTCITEKPLVREFDWVQKGDVLTDCSASNNGELAVGKNVLLAYIPWEGYNFEDAIVISERLVKEHVYTSLHIERYVFQAQDLKDGNEWFTKDLPGVEPRLIQHLEESGLPKIGSFLKEGDILVGKTRYLNKKPASPYERLLCDILGEKNFSARNKSLYVPKGVEARVVYHKVINVFENEIERKQGPIKAAKTIHLFLGEKRVIQVGDKISGRHGNKGVISTILPRQDMPYLPDGTPIDLILNPLGVPSRMNVGQVLECLLGLAASYLNQHFKIAAFDERYGVEASKSVVFLKLYQARLQSGQNWLFQVTFPGKTRLIDGRSGECFDQWITVGKAYILKLIHMVSEKIHARSTGPYALITQQPLRGRSNKGGQRLGEMEVWALEGFGAAYTLQELLTKKSDDFFGRKQIVDSILPNPSSIIDVLKPNSRVDQTKLVLGHPEIFKVLLCELQALCLDLGIYVLTPESFQRSFLGVVH